MDWLERMNSAMSYIEENLANEIDLEEVAKLAYCSAYHFPRVFSFMVGGIISGVYQTETPFPCRF